MIQFDHIEVHVTNSKAYVEFLLKLFVSSRAKKISKNNTYMFLTADNIRFEIKENQFYTNTFNIINGKGFCLPCFRMKGALMHLENNNQIQIIKTIQNPDGDCIFLKITKELIGTLKIMKF